MASTYEYLLRRKADLEVRMIEAQRRAHAPFEGELKALSLALGAIEQAGLAESVVAAETASFAPDAPLRRGRKSRSVREMILLILGKGDTAIAGTEITRQILRRWGRTVALATVTLELHGLEQEGVVRGVGKGWMRDGEPLGEAAAFSPSLKIA
ncbi:MarR family transcriptional regulator [soil metagenome]